MCVIVLSGVWQVSSRSHLFSIFVCSWYNYPIACAGMRNAICIHEVPVTRGKLARPSHTYVSAASLNMYTLSEGTVVR